MRLGSDFFAAPATELAPLLLGKYLCRRGETGVVQRMIITETECYFGEEDTACHAHRGKTPRTAVMYKPGGYAYIYLCYGIHCLLNIVTGGENHPEAVMIRGVEGISGPGRVTKRMNITRDLNGEDLCRSDRLWLEDGEGLPYECAPRVGVDYATPEYRDVPWRYIAVKRPQ